jgi:uncharacterized lipoprotein YajG
MNINFAHSLVSSYLLLAACASTPSSQPSAAPVPVVQTPMSNIAAARLVKSRDGKYTGEVKGIIALGSKLSKLEIGMSTSEVQAIFGRVPDRSRT